MSLAVAKAVAALAALAYFVVCFEEAVFQPSVDLSWLAAVVLWSAAWWRPEASPTPRLKHPLWLYAAYVIVLTPWATNWRWAITGDSLDWPLVGVNLAEHGLTKSLLSIHGAQQFNYLQTQLHNVFMFVVEPTLFWHRVGKIIVGALTMAAVYSVYARLVAPRFGLLVAGCTMTVTVLVVHAYSSYPLIDGIACGHALLAAGLWVRREPESRRAWLVLGWLSGFMLFVTPTAWFMGLCVWTWLALAALRRRWSLQPLVLGGITGVIVGLPCLLQWAQGRAGLLFSLVSNPSWGQRDTLPLLLEQALTIPFRSHFDYCGAFGPQLPPGFRWLFPIAIVLTPIFARHFPGARLMVSIYAAHIVLLALTQGPYGELSVKRALILIPMAVYFVFLPLHRWLRNLPVVLAVMPVWASFAVYNLGTQMRPGRIGDTLLDGVIEIHQRAADVPVCIFTPDDGRAQSFEAGSAVDVLYDVHPHVRRLTSVDDVETCGVLCFDLEREPIDLARLGFREFPMLGTTELSCGRRNGRG